jgi:hypothetical protein
MNDLYQESTGTKSEQLAWRKRPLLNKEALLTIADGQSM